jgi:hypothetical protein
MLCKYFTLLKHFCYIFELIIMEKIVETRHCLVSTTTIARDSFCK